MNQIIKCPNCSDGVVKQNNNLVRCPYCQNGRISKNDWENKIKFIFEPVETITNTVAETKTVEPEIEVVATETPTKKTKNKITEEPVES